VTLRRLELTMKTFPPHKSGVKKAGNSKGKSNSVGGGGGGHFNSKLHRHTQNHRLKAKSLKPNHISSQKRDGPSSSSFGGANTPEDSNCVVEKDKEDVRNEYDQFLQAFEKPTQIYRWLSVRHAVNPTFLNRSLSYMRARDRPRRDAYAKRRKSFKLQDLYDRSVEEETRRKIDLCGNSAYLNIQFTNFSEGGESRPEGAITVSANLTKHSFVKRKDLSSPTQTLACGSVTLDVGSSEPNANNTKVISLSCLNFINDDANEGQRLAEIQQSGTPLHSYHLELVVEHVITREAPITHVTTRSPSFDSETGEKAPPAKKRRISGGPVGNAKTSKTLRYSTELIIYDKNHKLFLEDGEYEVVMLPSDSEGFPIATVEQQTAKWDAPFDGSVIEPFEDVCQQQPTLAFLLNWSKAPGCFREKDVVTPSSGFGRNLNGDRQLTSSKIAVLDAIGVRTDALGEEAEKISNICVLDEEDDDVDDDEDERVEKPRTRGAPNAQPSNSIPSAFYSAKQKKPMRLFYNFSYRTQQQQQTEHKGNICPWCEVDCMGLYALLKHLRLSHPRFTFFCVPQAKSARIDVSINASYDGSFEGNSQDSALTRLGFSHSRCRAIQRTPMTQVLVYPGLRASRMPFEGTLDEFIEASTNGDDVGHADNRSGYMLGHNRLYYRSTTVQPMTAADMDYDSETDTKPGWLKTKMCKLMDDFTDVNWGEKEVLKLWNTHVMEHDFSAYRHLPELLQRFVRNQGPLMLEKQLENNYLQHLVNLHDFGLIKPSVVNHSFAALLRLKSNSESGAVADP